MRGPATCSTALGRPGTQVNTDRAFVGQLVATLSPAQILEVRAGWLWNRAPVCSPDVPPEIVALNTTGIGSIQRDRRDRVHNAVRQHPALFVDTQMVPQGSVVHTWTRGGVDRAVRLDVRLVSYDFANFGLGSPTYQFAGLVGPTVCSAAAPRRPPAWRLSTGHVLRRRGGLPRRHCGPIARSSTTTSRSPTGACRLAVTINVGLRYSISASTTSTARPTFTPSIPAVRRGGPRGVAVRPTDARQSARGDRR